jgi:hypothetical protein
MRVLVTGRAALSAATGATVVALVAGGIALALPASAGTPAPAGVPPQAQVGAPATTSGVVLGPAVKFVRDSDGTVRQVR